MSSFFEMDLVVSEKLLIFVADLLIKTLKLYVQHQFNSLCVDEPMW